MELFKLENMRDQIKDRINYLEGWIADASKYMRPNRAGAMVEGAKGSKIEEFKHWSVHLNLIEKEIEGHADTKVAKALELDRTECDCEECKAKKATSKTLAEGLIAAIRIKAALESQEKEEETEPKTPLEIFAEGFAETWGKGYRAYQQCKNRMKFAEVQGLIQEMKAEKAEAQKDQWKFTYNSWGNIGVLQEKIFDSREEAEGYMHEKISDCYEKSFRVSLEKISVM